METPNLDLNSNSILNSDLSLKVGFFAPVIIEKVFSNKIIISLNQETYTCFLRNIFIDSPKELFILKKLLKKNMYCLVFKIRSKPIIELYYDKDKTLSLSSSYNRRQVSKNLRIGRENVIKDNVSIHSRFEFRRRYGRIIE